VTCLVRARQAQAGELIGPHRAIHRRPERAWPADSFDVRAQIG
jgi:hypothetical protein